MHAFRKCAAVAALLAFSSAFGQAILIDEYTLQGTLADSLGGPPLASLGGTITPTGYVFAANQGLAFTNPALTSANFSIELSFKFDVTTGYRKIVDFLNLGSDSGLYQLNGNLNFYPVATTGTSDFASACPKGSVFVNGGQGISQLTLRALTAACRLARIVRDQ